MTDFGTRLQQAMQERRMSASDLSKASGVGKSLISYYINGKCLAKQDKIYLLAHALHVDPGWLMTGVEPKGNPGLDLQYFGAEPPDAAPQTEEARILAKGIDKLPKEQREQALAMFRVMFAPQYADLFNKGEEE